MVGLSGAHSSREQSFSGGSHGSADQHSRPAGHKACRLHAAPHEDYTDRMHLHCRLVFSGDEYNSGLVLQLSLPGHGVLLRGGRYDQLCINSGAGERVAAGMTIYIAKLLSCLEHQRPQKHAEWRTASNGMEVDVLVCSLGASVSDQRFEIVSQLWQAGIRADLSLLESSNLREHVELAQSVGAQHVVLIRPGKLTIKQLHVGRGRGNRKAQADDETFKTCADVAKYFISRRGTRARLENNDSWRA